MTESQARILVVEDERNVGLTLVERLRREGFDVAWATTREEAGLEIAQRKFNLALLDVGLPDGSGFEVAARLHQSQPAAAIIFLTAFGSPEDRIRGLELGAEDYIVKPFHLKELLLRVRNGLRRAQYLAYGPGGPGGSSGPGGPDQETEVGRARIRFPRFEAEVDGKIHPLTHKECALLKLLVDRRGSVVSRDEILNHVWSENEFPTSRTVDNFIMRLRRLVETDPENPRVIRSIRGVGYQLL